MFDFVRNLSKSEQEKRQEALSAYLDDMLPARRRQELERLLATDDDLRRELDLQRQIRQQMRTMPQRSVPRSFTLDPAAYDRPRKEPWVQAYPVLRAATALTAVFFVVALAASLFSFNNGAAGMVSLAPAMESELASAPEDTAELAPAEAFTADTAVPEAAESGVMAEESAPKATEVEGEMADAAAFSAEVAVEEAAAVEATAAPATAGGAVEESALPAPAATASPMPAEGLFQAAEPTTLPTATPSELPRPALDATAEADATMVERSATLSPPTEADTANAALSQAAPVESQPPSAPAIPSRAVWPIVAIGLGGVLVVLVVVTLAVRRRL